MPIVKCTNKDGRTYAYESHSYFDPVKKASRPRRMYLGRVDPVTGEIIPPKSKRGDAKKQETDKITALENDCAELRKKVLDMTVQGQQKEDTIRSQQREISRLQAKNNKLKQKLETIHRTSDLSED